MDNKFHNPNEHLWRHSPGTNRATLSSEQELEARLTDALDRMEDVPVPSNFTTRVLDAIDLHEKGTARHGWQWRMLFPRVAVATAILLFAGISLQQYEVRTSRKTLAREIASATVSEPVPGPDILDNLEAIERMGQSGQADTDLLAVLQ